MITIYTDNKNKSGKKVKKFLEEYGLEFNLKNVNDNPEYKKELVNLGYKDNLPITIIEGKEIIGYNPIELRDLI